MATQTLICGTGADDATVGTVEWVNPGNITADDANRASIHRAAAFQWIDNSIKFVKGGTISGNELSVGAQWPETETVATFGSPTDLSGLSMTAADINSSMFGFVMAAQITTGVIISHYLKGTMGGNPFSITGTPTGIQAKASRYWVDSSISFAPHVLVDTPSGHRRIGEIKKGDLILSFDAATMQVEADVVTAVRRGRRALGRLITEGSDTSVTPGHRYLTGDGQFREAVHLRHGDIVLRLVNGTMAPERVVSFTPLPVGDVVSLSVKKRKTYFADGLAVHNATLSSDGYVNYMQITVTYTPAAASADNFMAFF